LYWDFCFTSDFGECGFTQAQLGVEVAACMSGDTTPIDIASKASLRRTGVRSTCGSTSPYSGRDCVKSLRSTYTGVCPQSMGRWEGRCKATWKREFKLAWREAGPLNHHDSIVDSDQ